MKTTGRKDNLFSVLDQHGPFATGESVPGNSPFSADGRRFARQLAETHLATRYRMIREQIVKLLQISSFAEISRLHDNATRSKQIDQRAYELLANMFGISGDTQACSAAVNSYFQTADGVIRYLRNTVMAPYASFLEMTNNLYMVNNPVDLLLITFDDRYHQRIRFEAKRKLVLMKLAASIDQRERETAVEKKFFDFLQFLNTYVWSSHTKIGELEPAFLLSKHNPEDFSCRKVEVVTWPEGSGLQLEHGLKRTLIKRRWFDTQERKVPVYVTVRKKSPAAKVLKLLRKNEENPDIAVDDELGLMAVLDQLGDVRLFQQHLAECANQAGTSLTAEDVSDTLAGGNYHSNSIGSASKTPMLKFFARMGGMRVEFIVHTNASFLNYIYQRDVAHNEYEVRRLFDSGIAELLFPSAIYLLDMPAVKADLLRRYRQRIEDE